MAINGGGEIQAMQARLADLLPRLNERDRRLALATEAKSWGRGGISAVHQATGGSRTTIRRGITELADNSEERSSDRVRAPGVEFQNSVMGLSSGYAACSYSLIKPPRTGRRVIRLSFAVGDRVVWPRRAEL